MISNGYASCDIYTIFHSEEKGTLILAALYFFSILLYKFLAFCFFIHLRTYDAAAYNRIEPRTVTSFPFAIFLQYEKDMTHMLKLS